MKRLRLWLWLGLVVVIGGAIVLALQMGEKSPLYAAGQVTIADDLLAKSKGIRTLYIILYDASGMPMPYGAMREHLSDDIGSAGMPFLITAEKLQVMNSDRPVPQSLRIKARLDLDGVAGMDQAGDLVGEIANVPFGVENIEIKISKRIGSD